MRRIRLTKPSSILTRGSSRKNLLNKEEKVEKRSEKYLYMEYLRVLCSFMVIVTHVSGVNWFKMEIGSISWIIQAVFNIGGRFSVCVFCMISGALFLNPDKSVTVHDVFHKYIKRIMICFIPWLIFYAAFYTMMNSGDLSYFIQRLFKLPKHLWYLLMLVGMYLATPVLKLIVRDRTLTRYMIRILLVFGAVFGTAEGITGFLKPMAGESFGFSLWTTFLANLGNLNVSFVPGYLGLFLAGHYIHEYGLGKWNKLLKYAAIPALLLSALLTVVLSKMTNSYVWTLMLETNPLITAASAGIFAFFRDHIRPEMQEGHPASSLSKAAVWIAGRSMGIYLVHLAVLEYLGHYLGLSVASFTPIFSVPLISLLIFLISLGISAVLTQIPLVKNTVL